MVFAPVKCAIVGCGAISGIYFENLRNMFAITELVGCCDLRAETAEAAAQKYGVKAMTMEEILADDSIELVVNLTTPGAHYPVIKQLLEGGKHVYTEKMLATTIADGRALCKLADEKGLLLGCAPDTFLGAAVQTARLAADSGLIGEITGCVANLNRDCAIMAEKYPFTTRPGGGIGTDVAIYYVTALLSILGPAVQVCGMSDTLQPKRSHYFTQNGRYGEAYEIECENLLSGSVRFASGAIGSLYFNANSIQNEKPQLVLYGTQGMLYIPDPNHFGSDVEILLKGQTEAFVLPHTHAYSENSRGLGVAELAWALRRGRAPRAGKELACHGLELLLGIIQSGEEGKFYDMQTTFERPAPLPRGYMGANYSQSQPEGGLGL